MFCTTMMNPTVMQFVHLTELQKILNFKVIDCGSANDYLIIVGMDQEEISTLITGSGIVTNGSSRIYNI